MRVHAAYTVKLVTAETAHLIACTFSPLFIAEFYTTIHSTPSFTMQHRRPCSTVAMLRSLINCIIIIVVLLVDFNVFFIRKQLEISNFNSTQFVVVTSSAPLFVIKLSAQ